MGFHKSLQDHWDKMKEPFSKMQLPQNSARRLTKDSVENKPETVKMAFTFRIEPMLQKTNILQLVSNAMS